MIRRQKSVLAAMDRIREVVLAQQHALAEQRSRDEASKARQSEISEETLHFHEKQEGGGGFAGADPKKRRGVSGYSFTIIAHTDGFQRNAPPGRCHSCNRAETPEWRRGPDGARTLCNACGLRKFSRHIQDLTDIERLRKIDAQAWPKSFAWKFKSEAQRGWTFSLTNRSDQHFPLF